jgi:hypothetical protein
MINSTATAKQRPPRPNENARIIDLVMEDLRQRAEMGKETYNTYLQPFNGREALVDAYQEALDLCMYLKQAIQERSINKNDY